jgi:hypothetical protein
MSTKDNALDSLMNDWSQQQGYKTTTTALKTPSSQIEPTSLRVEPSLLELEGYPNNSFLAGSNSIWNPYVQGPIADGDSDDGIAECCSTVVSTNPHVEVIRRRCYETFKKDCQECVQRILQSWDVKISIPSVLEKWHMDAKHEERRRYEMSNKRMYPIMASSAEINSWTRQDFHNYFDPMLLSKQSAYSLAAILKDEVMKAWKQQHKDSTHDAPLRITKKLGQVQKAVVHFIMTCRESFATQLQQASNQSLMKSFGTRAKLPKVDRKENLVHVTYAGNTFKIHTAYYEKLQRLFHRQQNQQDPSNSSFQEALFCMLCRYDTLQGAGLQAGVPGSIMDVLLDKLQCRMELFASPLNCRYETFASAFELDMMFGSRANFFHLAKLQSGCYQANPPFCDGVIGALSTKLQSFLSNETDALMFVVFVPAWKESQSYQKLLNHSFLVQHILLDQGKHWYAEGTQHRRQGSFRVASFDTSIFIYQNEAAKVKWQVDQALVDALTHAFCEEPGAVDKVATIPETTTTTMQIKEEQKYAYGVNERIASKKRKAEAAKQKRGKKRNFTNHEEEHKSHMGLLASLGLASVDGSNKDDMKRNTTSPSEGEKTTDFLSKKSKKKRKKKIS